MEAAPHRTVLLPLRPNSHSALPKSFPQGPLPRCSQYPPFLEIQQPLHPLIHPPPPHTHHVAGDDYDRMIKGDPGIEDIYSWTAEGQNVPMRGANGVGDGVHILTGPIYVCDAEPGDVLQVRRGKGGLRAGSCWGVAEAHALQLPTLVVRAVSYPLLYHRSNLRRASRVNCNTRRLPAASCHRKSGC